MHIDIRVSVLWLFLFGSSGCSSCSVLFCCCWLSLFSYSISTHNTLSSADWFFSNNSWHFAIPTFSSFKTYLIPQERNFWNRVSHLWDSRSLISTTFFDSTYYCAFLFFLLTKYTLLSYYTHFGLLCNNTPSPVSPLPFLIHLCPAFWGHLLSLNQCPYLPQDLGFPLPEVVRLVTSECVPET
jgi:hypothetical protein